MFNLPTIMPTTSIPTTTTNVSTKQPRRLLPFMPRLVGTSLMDSQPLEFVHQHDHSYSRMQNIKNSAPSIPPPPLYLEHLYCKLRKPVQVEASTSSVGSQGPVNYIRQQNVDPFPFEEHSYCCRKIQELELEAPLRRSTVEASLGRDEPHKWLQTTEDHSYCLNYTVPLREHSYCRPLEYLNASYKARMSFPCSAKTECEVL